MIHSPLLIPIALLHQEIEDGGPPVRFDPDQVGSQTGEDGGPPQTDGNGDDGGFFGGSPLPLILIGAVFWFVLIAPERKQRKKRESMISALKKGDKIMTNSGIYGQIIQIKDQVVSLQISDNTRIRIHMSSLQGLENEPAAGDAAPEKDKKEAEKD